MRPYRGKTKDGKWVYGHYDYDYANNQAIIHSREVAKVDIGIGSGLADKYHEVLPETVGHAIGLCSKKDHRNLYGGDRVVIGNDRGVLVWDEYDLCWALQLDSDDSFQAICRYYSAEEIENIEYLGTIHDKGKK